MATRTRRRFFGRLDGTSAVPQARPVQDRTIAPKRSFIRRIGIVRPRLLGRSSQGRRKGVSWPRPKPHESSPLQERKPSLTPEVLGGSEKRRKKPPQEPSRSEGRAGKKERGRKLGSPAAEASIRGPPCPSAVDPAAICTAAAVAGVGGGGPSPCSVFPGGVVVVALVLVLVVEGRGVCE